MTKLQEKELLNKMLAAGNYFYLYQVANELGIENLTHHEVDSVISAFLSEQLKCKEVSLACNRDNGRGVSVFHRVWFSPDTRHISAARRLAKSYGSEAASKYYCEECGKHFESNVPELNEYGTLNSICCPACGSLEIYPDSPEGHSEAFKDFCDYENDLVTLEDGE